MSPPNPLDRRRFLAVAAGAFALSAGCTTASQQGGSAGSTGDTTGSSAGNAFGPTDPAVLAAESARTSTGRVSRHNLRAAPARLSIGNRQVDTWAFDAALPGKEIRVRRGDTIEVALKNDLPEDTTIHWHGLALRNDMDGVHDLTQPPIRAGETFTYTFVAPHAGTYWFHPHMGTQLDRALYAPLIIEDPDDPARYDVDQVIILDDWLDGVGRTPDDVLRSLASMNMSPGSMESMPGMDAESMGMPKFDSELLGGDAGDVDYPIHLINGRPPADRPTISVPAGGRARLRLINAASDTAYRVAVGGHRMTVTHTDGFPVIPVEVDALLIGMGERYDVIVQPNSGAWPLVALAEGKGLTTEAVIRTTDAAESGAPPLGHRPDELDGRLLGLDDLRATEPVRLATRAPDVDELIKLTGSMMPYTWAFDGVPYPDRQPLEIRSGQRVRLTFENTTSMWHPIHLHGHTFRVGDDPTGARKDTVNVLPGQRVAIEFDADNPGRWMIHCHNTYHLERGMAMVTNYVA